MWVCVCKCVCLCACLGVVFEHKGEDIMEFLGKVRETDVWRVCVCARAHTQAWVGRCERVWSW